jgi:CRISPR/Cas system CSM-associated protein Csm2 small subunit
MSNSDRRHRKRLAVNANVKIQSTEGRVSRSVNAYFPEVKDMTQRGFFLKTKNPLPVNTKLIVEIKFPSEKEAIIAHAKVVRIARPSDIGCYPGMGVYLTKIKRTDGIKINRFLKEKFQNYRHALELKKMYTQLKEMAARLYELERSHMQAEHFKIVIEHAIKEIDNIAHILDREVWEVKRL